MTQSKKRPSKAAKAARKVLEDSKLLAANKAKADADLLAAVKPGESTAKPAAAIKPRPGKKRG